MVLPSSSRTLIDRSAGCTFTTVAWNHCRRAFSLVTPRLSVIFPCLIRVGRRCTNVLMPPSGYSITSTCADSPVTCVKRPTSSESVGIDTLNAFACWTWGLGSAVPLAGGMGGSQRVVDDQVAHLLALGEQIALE